MDDDTRNLFRKTNNAMTDDYILVRAHLQGMLRTYVANRVTKNQNDKNSVNWHYVPSGEKSTDLASTGCILSELIDNQKWCQVLCEHPPRLSEINIDNIELEARKKDESFHIEDDSIETIDRKLNKRSDESIIVLNNSKLYESEKNPMIIPAQHTQM